MAQDQVVYICVGTCKAEISDARYKQGLMKCGTEGCTLKGHDFKKMLKCARCGDLHTPETSHTH